MKDLSGAVGTMEMVDWDWETQGTEAKQKKFKDFLQSNQWQEECIGQCLWTSKAMFGFVEGIAMENWGWATQHKSIRLRKTTIFLELLLLQEGMVIFQCFWTNKEMFSLVGTISMGSWDWETRKTDTRVGHLAIPKQEDITEEVLQYLEESSIVAARSSAIYSKINMSLLIVEERVRFDFLVITGWN